MNHNREVNHNRVRVSFSLPQRAVLECVVIAVPDEKWGEISKAIKAQKPNARATEKELVDFCRECMAAFKPPKSIVFVSELPKTGSGKNLIVHSR